MKPTKQPPPVEVPFPILGVNTSVEPSRQPPRTTPVATNVRSFDTALRLRGGSRPGLSRYIDEQVSAVYVDEDDTHEASITYSASTIQHLAVLVDPTTDAVLVDYDDDDPNLMDDPSDNPTDGRRSRNPGRKIRRGGSGRRPNRNQRKPRNGSKNITFIQKAQRTYDPDGGAAHSITRDLAFTTTPLPLSLLVVVVVANMYTIGDGDTVVSTVTDTRGNTYNALTRNDSRLAYSDNVSLSVFYTSNTNDAMTANTVTVVNNIDSRGVIAILEYKNVQTFQSVANTFGYDYSGPAAGLPTLVAGPVGSNALGMLALMVFAAGGSFGFGSATGFKTRVYDATGLVLRIADKITRTFADVTATITAHASQPYYVSRATMFRRG